MKLIYVLLFGSLILSLVLSSCKDGSVNTIIVDTSKNNGFLTKEVADIFSNNCATSGCHSGNNPSSGLSLKNWSDLLKGSSGRSNGTIPNYGGEVIIPGRLDESFLYQMLIGNVTPAITAHANVNLDTASVNAIRDWISGGAFGYHSAVPFNHPSYNVYVNNQNSDKVSVIDGDLKVVSGIIDVKKIPQITNSPHMVKVQDGFLYVSLIAAGNFLKMDISDPTNYHEVGETGDHTIEKAGMIILHPNGNKAFVSRSSTSSPIYQSIYAVNLNDMSTEEITIATPGVPHGMAITPDGSKLYIANLSLDRISIVNGNTNEYGDFDDIVLPAGTQPMQTMISPDGNYLYVSARGTSKLLVFDVHSDSLLTQVSVNGMPMQIAVTSDGNKIYLGSMMMGTVEVIQKNGMIWNKIKSIMHPGFRMVHGCDITGDDKYVYVSCRNTDPNNQFQPYYKVNGENPPGFVGIIDTQTDEVVKFLEIEEFGSGLVVSKN